MYMYVYIYMYIYIYIFNTYTDLFTEKCVITFVISS